MALYNEVYKKIKMFDNYNDVYLKVPIKKLIRRDPKKYTKNFFKKRLKTLQVLILNLMSQKNVKLR